MFNGVQIFHNKVDRTKAQDFTGSTLAQPPHIDFPVCQTKTTLLPPTLFFIFCDFYRKLIPAGGKNDHYQIRVTCSISDLMILFFILFSKVEYLRKLFCTLPSSKLL